VLVLCFVRLVALDDFGLRINWVVLRVLLSVGHLGSIPERSVLIGEVWLVVTKAAVTFIGLVVSLLLAFICTII